MVRRNNKKNNLKIKSKSERVAGILLPISSLNSGEGVGDFGKAAYNFIDIISDIGFKIWQILPLNPLGYGNSPYQPYSSYAGDEIYISLEKLFEEKLLRESPPKIINTNKVDYAKVRQYKEKYLKKAFKNFSENEEYQNFKKNETIFNYAVFLTFKKINKLLPWNKWARPMKNWIIDKKLDLICYRENIEYEIFVQYIFHKQWMELKKYANLKNVKIMGDIPIYVGFDSQDVWENRDAFLLNKLGNPKLIAGVPPDNFSKTGQRWGNPIYNWDNIQKDDFRFWVDRIGYNYNMYDIIRIDHFRAFDTYWCINPRNKTAMKGKWVEAPGYELFEKIFKVFPDIQIVAEDLGDIREQVLRLRDYFGLKGMIILQYAFDSKDMTKSRKSIKRFNKKDSIIYTGTHDNQTVVGWYNNLSNDMKKYVQKILKKQNCTDDNIVNSIMEYLFKSNSDYAIIPLQDIIGLGDESRINTPSTLNDINWTYKFTDMEKLKEKSYFLKKLIINTDRK